MIYGPELDKRCRAHLKLTNKSYRVDETYIRIKGQDRYLYRAVDSTGQTIDFLLKAERDTSAAKRFFRKLPIERRASENTRDSYAYAFQLLLTFASKRLKMTPSQLAVEQIDAPLVLDFLNDLETTRGNRPSSRNIRLAAIKSFMHFLKYRVPSAIEQIRRILAIPAKRAESRLVRHLTAEEIQAVTHLTQPGGKASAIAPCCTCATPEVYASRN